MKHNLAALSLALVILQLTALPATFGQTETSETEGARDVQAEPATITTGKIVYVPMVRGSVGYSDLFNAVADDLHWVAASVADITSEIGVEGKRNQMSPARVRGMVDAFPAVFSIAEDPTTGREALAVDTGRLARRLADKKSRLRSWLAAVRKQRLSELTSVRGTWPKNPAAPPRIVVLLAGLHGVETTAGAVALKLHERTNLPMSVFAYPNDAPIRESSQRLTAKLEELHRRYPSSAVSLVTHSMGSLVARAAIELGDRTSKPPRATFTSRTGVDQLIQICPPNHGSALAEYGPLLEGAEQLHRLINRGGDKRSRLLLRMITDGFNEAPADLQPGSEFLTELNRCQRNGAVRYTILAGNDGPLLPGVSLLLDEVWGQVALLVEEPAFLDRRVRELLGCAELKKGSGDGVVSLDSARLDGVEDFEILNMHHLTWNELDSRAGQKLIVGIASRLGISL